MSEDDYSIIMGCTATSMVLSANNLINIQHRLIHLAVTEQTSELIDFITLYNYEIDINSAINFRGDTLLHYACFKNNKQLVEYLTKRSDCLRTKKNYSKKIPLELTTDEDIKKLCS